jgi:hypothetical protein
MVEHLVQRQHIEYNAQEGVSGKLFGTITGTLIVELEGRVVLTGGCVDAI